MAGFEVTPEEGDVRDAVIDFLKAHVFGDADSRDIVAAGVRADAAVGADVAYLDGYEIEFESETDVPEDTVLDGDGSGAEALLRYLSSDSTFRSRAGGGGTRKTTPRLPLLN